MQKALLFSLLAILAVFAVIWIADGAPQEIAARKGAYPNPVRAWITGATSSAEFQLPRYEIPFVPAAPSITDVETQPYPVISSDPRALPAEAARIERELAQLERQYGDLSARLSEAREFGNPSPYRGAVSIQISASEPRAAAPAAEHITIAALPGNRTPVSIAGWSLQSMHTGVRVYVPAGVELYRMGEISQSAPIALAPGASAVISSGVSPVGVSFRENICTGYLDQFQPFAPPLRNACPSPTELLPPTQDTYASYGSSCVEFVQGLSRCEYYVEELPAHLSNTCRSFIRNAISYNDCVDRSRWNPGFTDGSWRLFLNSHQELWRNDRETLRLLDAEGRTVDVWAY